jgi:hypothetical protein
MKIVVHTAVVLATVAFVEPVCAQTRPLVSFTTASAEGPIARATALELAKLEQAALEEFNREDPLRTGEARHAEAAAAAARQSKRGVIGAVIGATVGAIVGVGLAVGYATRDCGSSCNDERVMIGVSLIGIPVAGGLAGYHIAK